MEGLGPYRKSPKFFSTVSFPTPYGLLFPKIGVRNPYPKLQSLLSQNNNRVHPNKSPLKFWEKREHERIQGLPKFFWYPLLSLRNG